MKTALVTSNTYEGHDTGPGHPEQIARVSVVIENFKKLNNKNILWKEPTIITDEILKATHDEGYIELVKNSFPIKGFSSLDGDTIISPGSKKATFDAAGLAIETGAVGVRHNSTVAATATIASGETLGLVGDVTFTGTVTVAGEMVVV